MKRYPEGGNPPVLKFDDAPRGNVDARTDLQIRRRTKYLVPTTADVVDRRSKTSEAKKCFVERHFSKTLQDFMLSYSYTMVTTKVLSGEL